MANTPGVVEVDFVRNRKGLRIMLIKSVKIVDDREWGIASKIDLFKPDLMAQSGERKKSRVPGGDEEVWEDLDRIAAMDFGGEMGVTVRLPDTLSLEQRVRIATAMYNMEQNVLLNSIHLLSELVQVDGDIEVILDLDNWQVLSEEGMGYPVSPEYR